MTGEVKVCADCGTQERVLYECGACQAQVCQDCIHHGVGEGSRRHFIFRCAACAPFASVPLWNRAEERAAMAVDQWGNPRPGEE